jgi:single-strand DNA-binding protein
MNRVQLIGRLGREPRGGVAGRHVYSNLSIATNEYFYNKEGMKIEQTTWHRVTCWGRIAEFSNEYLCTGRLVLVEGRLQNRQYTDSEGVARVVVEVVAQRITALDSRPQWMSEQEHVGDQHVDHVNQTLQQ